MFKIAVLFGAFYFLCYSTSPISAMTAEQHSKIHEHFEMLGMECMKDYPITEDDISNFRAKKMATGEHASCFVACVMKKIGIIDDKGMLQKESALELARKVFDDDEEVKNISDYLHSCSHINSEVVGDGEKGCERAAKAFTCMKENAGQFGFEL